MSWRCLQREVTTRLSNSHTQSSWGSPPSLGAHTLPALCSETSQCSCLSLIPCLGPPKLGILAHATYSYHLPSVPVTCTPEAVAPQGDELVPTSVGFFVCAWKIHKLLVVKPFSLMTQQQLRGSSNFLLSITTELELGH